VGAIVLQYAGNIAAWRARAATLTKREHDLLELVRGGKSNKEIAYSLQLTAGTVKVHLNNIFRKLGVTSRGELRRIAAEFPLDEGHG
jgi:DNA-binding CsgD family transcriptional regulator